MTDISNKKVLYIGIILIAIGIVLTITVKNADSIGTVFMTLGGLFLVIGIAKKKEFDRKKKNKFD